MWTHKSNDQLKAGWRFWERIYFHPAEMELLNKWSKKLKDFTCPFLSGKYMTQWEKILMENESKLPSLFQQIFEGFFLFFSRGEKVNFKYLLSWIFFGRYSSWSLGENYLAQLAFIDGFGSRETHFFVATFQRFSSISSQLRGPLLLFLSFQRRKIPAFDISGGEKWGRGNTWHQKRATLQKL